MRRGKQRYVLRFGIFDVYVPTGYGRHALTVQTAPRLYRFLRANFCRSDGNTTDLTAEFVDLFHNMA